MTICEKVAYLKGLAEGLNLDTEKSKEGKLINVIIGILEEIGMSIEDIEENSHALSESIDALSDDLDEVESVLYADDDDDDDDDYDFDDFDDDDDEDEDEIDDDWFEATCTTCGTPFTVDLRTLKSPILECPKCGARYSISINGAEADTGEAPKDDQ